MEPEHARRGVAATELEARSWSAAKCIGFRFTCAYFVVYNFPFPFSALPYTEKATGPYDRLWELIVPWVGAHILHLAKPITIFPGGSGDTTFNYVQLLCFVVIAVAATIVWTRFVAKPSQYLVARDRLRTYLRYALATTMLSYGAFKVIKSQFPNAGLERLATPFGQSSAMGVLWWFMGSSYPCNLFTGMGEMVGAAPADSTKRWSLDYARGDRDRPTMEGMLGADSLRLILRRVDHTKFLLLSRGYHWINEFPMNK